jgi:hypothetical protein
MATTSNLAEEYKEFCLKDLDECKRLGYYPSYFLQMLQEYGAMEAIRRLVNSEKMPEGFSRLWELKLLDLTLEAGTYDNPRFRPFFDATTLAACDARLASVGYI